MRRRAQLVLVAAAVAALAFLPVVAAYLQLGYAGDAHAMAGRGRLDATAVSALDRAVDLARPGLARNYSWLRRRSAVTAYPGALDSYRRHVGRSRVDGGTGVVADPGPTLHVTALHGGLLLVANATASDPASDLASLSLAVDGRRVRSVRSSGRTAHLSTTRLLFPGRHTVAVLAVDARGQRARRTATVRVGFSGL